MLQKKKAGEKRSIKAGEGSGTCVGILLIPGFRQGYCLTPYITLHFGIWSNSCIACPICHCNSASSWCLHGGRLCLGPCSGRFHPHMKDNLLLSSSCNLLNQSVFSISLIKAKKKTYLLQYKLAEFMTVWRIHSVVLKNFETTNLPDNGIVELKHIIQW